MHSQLIFAISGVNFPVGVLIYWSTTNLWTWGQQYYVIKRNPTPGSPAYEELQRKRNKQNGVVENPETPQSSEGANRGKRSAPTAKKEEKEEVTTKRTISINSLQSRQRGHHGKG